MKNFPVLYTKTSTGAIQFWEIQAEKMHDLCDSQIQVGVIETTYGHLGTDKPQKSTDYIKEGKNIGKANATTPYEQACKEAEAKWIKQKKGGYVETKEGAEAGERDALIKGGVDPMLAHSYMDVIHDLRPGLEGNVSYELTKDAKKIKFPAFAQPKLDGIRCEGEFTGAMWSRTRKVIPHLPHLREAIARAAGELAVGEFLDGELYNHAYKNDFEKITSAVGQKDAPSPDHELVEFHVYDLVTHTPFNFKERQRALDRMGVGSFANIKRVETVVVNSHKELMSYFEKCLALGYEGCMVRNGNSLYEENKRSYHLQKLKDFQDDEFKIVGFEEGRGKLAGRLGNFICETKNGQETFDPPMNVSLYTLKTMFENGQSYIGKMLTVRYQGFTGANKVPRFPKGKAIRDYE